MKILYMSCHIVLEYDELRILHSLGHDVFVIGGYIDPRSPQNQIRPPLEIVPNEDLLNQYYSMSHQNFLSGVKEDECGKTFTKEFIDQFDCIIVMHRLDWIELNWSVFKNKAVILRTIGQNLSDNELKLKTYMNMGVRVVRYSPFETQIPNYAGQHAEIRFLKYLEDFKPRNVMNETTITFGQSVTQRGIHCLSNVILSVGARLPFVLYGPNNESHIYNGGYLTYQEQINVLSQSGAYFYTGTYPAQYTLNFMEAMLAGIPVVAVGEKLAHSHLPKYPYEVPSLLSGLYNSKFDTIDEIVYILREIATNPTINKLISDKQIEVATDLFSAEKNAYKWSDFLNTL